MKKHAENIFFSSLLLASLWTQQQVYCIALKRIAGLDQGPHPCYSKVYHTVTFPLLHMWIRRKIRVLLFFSLLTADLVGTMEGATSKFFFHTERSQTIIQ